MKRWKRSLLWVAIFSLAVLAAAGCSQTASNNASSGKAAPANENKSASNSPKEETKKPDWPTKPITILVWSKAGSGVDVMGRFAAKFLEKELGKPVVVENKTGGDGAVAMKAILGQPADGYSLGVNTRSQMISLNSDLKGQIDPKGFEFISQNQGDPYVLAVKADTNLKTLNDFINAAKTVKNFSVGGFGANSAFSFYMEEFAKQAQIKVNWIPYLGGSEATTQLLGGHINAAVTNVGQVMKHVKAGTLRVLAVSTKQRMAELPDTPTFKELGYKGLDVTHWRGFYVKKGTPKEIIAKLDELFKKLSQDKEWQNSLKASGLTNDFVPSKETAAEIEKELKSFDQLINGKK